MTEKRLHTALFVFGSSGLKSRAKETGDSHLRKQNKEKKKKKSAVLELIRAYLRYVSVYFLQELRPNMRPQLLNGERPSTLNSLLLPFRLMRADIDKIYRSQHNNTIHIIRWQADPGNI